jgi:signal transduction histidine kinase
MTHATPHISKSLQQVKSTLEESMRFYEKVHMSDFQDTLLKAYVDIVHKDHGLNHFFKLSVTVSMVLQGLQSRFYLYDKENDHFLCVCDSSTGLTEAPEAVRPLTLPLSPPAVQEHDNWLYYPLYPRPGTGRQEPLARQQEQGPYDPDPYFASHSLLGLYAVSSDQTISHSDKDFFEILTSWIGNKLNNRLIAKRHREHLQFLNSLGRDIGHNIIVPNMYLKYLLRQVEKQVDSLKDLEQGTNKMFSGDAVPSSQFIQFQKNCRTNRESLERTFLELAKHHKQVTLFLESLFREQHFKEGKFVLKPSRCYIERDIIIPQLNLYKKKLERVGITVEHPTNLHSKHFPLMVDIGLLSQVYMNLFSNAVKYTESIINHRGKPKKILAYGVEKIENFPVAGQQGLKLNVFTSGTPLGKSECQQIFTEGYRSENSADISGSGHGLDFVRRVISVHGGESGCEPTDEGNNFFFILPLTVAIPEMDYLKEKRKHSAA